MISSAAADGARGGTLYQGDGTVVLSQRRRLLRTLSPPVRLSTTRAEILTFLGVVALAGSAVAAAEAPALASAVQITRDRAVADCAPADLTWRPIGRLRGGRYAAGGAVVPLGAVDAGREGLYVYGGLSVEPGRTIERAESTLMRLALNGPVDPDRLADLVSDVQGGVPERWGMGSAFVSGDGHRPPSLVFVGGSDSDPVRSPTATPTAVPPHPQSIASSALPVKPLTPLTALAGGDASVDPYVVIEFPPTSAPRRPVRAVSIAPALDHAFGWTMDGATPLFLWHGGHRRTDERATVTERLFRRAALDTAGLPRMLADASGPSARFGHTLVAMDPPVGAISGLMREVLTFVLYGGTLDGGLVVARSDALWKVVVPADLSSPPTYATIAADAPMGQPIPSFFHAAGWDADRRWLVIYGGFVTSGASGVSPSLNNETWALDASADPPRWLHLSAARLDGRGYVRSTMVWDPDVRRLLLFGGRRENNTNFRVFALGCPDTAPTATRPTETPVPWLTPTPIAPTSPAVPGTASATTVPTRTQSPEPQASATRPSAERSPIFLPVLASGWDQDDSPPECRADRILNDIEPNDTRADTYDRSLVPESTRICGWFPVLSRDDRDLYRIMVPSDRLFLGWLDTIPASVRWDLLLLDADGSLVGCSDPWDGDDGRIDPTYCGYARDNVPVAMRRTKIVTAAIGSAGTYFLSVRNRFGRTNQRYTLWWHTDPAESRASLRATDMLMQAFGLGGQHVVGGVDRGAR